jgi:hypothetical protein
MVHDWVTWAILALMLIQAITIPLNLRSSARIMGGPLSRISSILAAIGFITMSMGFVTMKLRGLPLPGVISGFMMAIGVALLALSLLVRVVIPWLRDSRQHLPDSLRRLTEQEIAVGTQLDREMQARRNARRQSREARRQA